MSQEYSLMLNVRDPEDGVTYGVECEIEEEDTRYRVSFPFHELLKDELKAAFNARWGMISKSDPKKVWDLQKSPRTTFRLMAMQWLGLNAKTGKPKVPGTYDPYARYKLPLEKLDCPPRHYKGVITPYYEHQAECGIPFVWTRRSCLLAYEPGTGKTLIIGRVMEEAKKRFGWKDSDFIYVCKKGALFQVELDYDEWQIGVKPRFMSYDDMKSEVSRWTGPAPRFVVFDESTQIKTPSAQRSEQALHLADAMREEWGDECFVVCMTGTPAPKNPVDWWHQVEVCCPGFIREGSKEWFERRMSIGQKQQKEDGGIYNKRVGWLDDERKCKVCTKFADDVVHSKVARLDGTGHGWLASKNEVFGIYKRLKGIVDIKLKKDCLDLPEKTYRRITVRPTQMMLNAARLISKKASGKAQALTLLRELSDGFQYVETDVGTKVCPMCSGSGTMLYKYDPEDPFVSAAEVVDKSKLVEGTKDCDQCCGAGTVSITQRTVSKVACPKDAAVEDLLDEHREIGRIPFYAGFEGSVDRLVDLCLKNEWHVIRIDGRGWTGFSPKGMPPMPRDGKELYRLFRYGQKEYPRIAIVAQASTAGHGLNLEVCPTIVYFSNDYNGESRMQSEERNLRGAIAQTLKQHGLTKVTIVDIIHLPSDDLVLKNLYDKKKMQSMTLGDIQGALEAVLN